MGITIIKKEIRTKYRKPPNIENSQEFLTEQSCALMLRRALCTGGQRHFQLPK